MKEHWEKIYSKKDEETLGWYEENPESSLQLIRKCNLDKNARILNIGAGATTLVDRLLELDYNSIIASDLSSAALNKIKTRIGSEQSAKIKWIVDDLTNTTVLNTLEPIDLWHDRAVLHFFNDLTEQDSYFNLVHKLVKLGGYVIIAVFNLNGALKCSGLPVYRYDDQMLQEKLGADFSLLEAFDYTYIMPSGDKREYVYTLFQRIK
jgi:cyclopropane fatty-acyl-phospholipid synthase-like methyltransferase